MPARAQLAALEMRGVEKSFGPTRALRGVDLEVAPGEVHALLGENGAGKSTLMRVLAGVIAPEAGELRLFGEVFAPRDPLDARDSGVVMIHQELTLAPHLTVAENIMLGREVRRGGFLRRREMENRATEALATLEHSEIAPGRRVGDLGPGARQVVEIARALVGRARILVLDEPTSSLDADDVARLFAVVRRLVDGGLSVVYISHFLDEVDRIADRFTVLRDGLTVARGRVADAEHDDWVEWMAGRRVDAVYPTRRGAAFDEVALELQDLVAEPLPAHASLALHRGEILGVAGLCGAGRTELLRAIFGLSAVRSGTIVVAGACDAGADPPRRLAQGVCLLSEDRKTEGLMVNRGVAENMCLSRQEPFVERGLLRPARRRAAAHAIGVDLDIRMRDADQPVGELSGGNQQKVAFARLLHHHADVLLLDEPTRGIDVASKATIYRQMVDLADAGKAILIASSHLPELLGVCDRIAVMARGRLGACRAAGAWSERELLDVATRAQ